MEKKERSSILYYLALFKKGFSEVMENVFKKDISVKIANEKVFYSYLGKLSQRLDGLQEELKELNEAEKVKVGSTAIKGAQKQSQHAEIVRKFDELKSGIEPILETFQVALDKIAKKDMVVNVPPLPKFELPKEYKVKGTVSVENPPDLSDLKKLIAKMDEVKKAVVGIRIPEVPDFKFPEIKIPKQEAPKINLAEVTRALKELKDAVEDLPKKMESPEFDFPEYINIGNFPPQHIPTPVTNFNLNPLRGVPLSTAVTVPTTPQALPSNPLANRRSIIIYNNSSQTVYIGHSAVNIQNGLPVLRGTYSPPIDAGPRMIIYAIVATGTAEVRVLEVSNDASGSD